jgi:DNA-binding GntR family transcriptional regulator
VSAQTSPPSTNRRTLLPDSSRRQQVVDVLRDEITTGRRASGEQLKQDQIARELGVSPGPVREALRQLESEGLAELVPNRGVFVAEISPAELIGLLLPVRLAIESYAVPAAISRLRAEHLDDLQEIVDQMGESARTNDLARINELDVRFHEITVEAADSLHALQLWRSVQPRIRAQFYRLAPRHGAPEEIQEEHRQLLDVIRSGDDDALRTAIREHIVDSAQDLLSRTPEADSEHA